MGILDRAVERLGVALNRLAEAVGILDRAVERLGEAGPDKGSEVAPTEDTCLDCDWRGDSHYRMFHTIQHGLPVRL